MSDPVITKLSSKKEESFIASGTDLDGLIGGGFPRSRITELWGREGVGKSHIATLLMANISKNNKVLYVDAEYSLNKVRVAALGANPANIDYIAESGLETVTELIIKAVGKYDLIILDSLAVLTPLTVANQEVGERSIGLFALLIKHFVVKLRPLLANSKTAFVALNQFRPPIGLYATESPPGGMVWVHSCDVRIKLTTNSADKITKDKEVVGHWVKCEVKKNKLGKPHTTAKVRITY